jgi:hypothetical protein
MKGIFIYNRNKSKTGDIGEQMLRDNLKQQFSSGLKITESKIHNLIDFDQVKIFNVGDVSGVVALDLDDGSFQVITVVDDITSISIANMVDGVLFIHVNNSGDHGINTNFADYKIGVIPSGPAEFGMAVYKIGDDIYLTIGETYL